MPFTAVTRITFQFPKEGEKERKKRKKLFTENKPEKPAYLLS
jgi:hypothetical protein